MNKSSAYQKLRPTIPAPKRRSIAAGRAPVGGVGATGSFVGRLGFGAEATLTGVVFVLLVVVAAVAVVVLAAVVVVAPVAVVVAAPVVVGVGSSSSPSPVPCGGVA
ncbi:MAG: hypothetical protein JNK05_14115 [Myxococcales bacterium]|nr:hypothetical protein [Myxococcales bacterium]